MQAYLQKVWNFIGHLMKRKIMNTLRMSNSKPALCIKRPSFSTGCMGLDDPNEIIIYVVWLQAATKFLSVHDWNSHYRIRHKMPLKCNLCPKRCTTPSSLRDHHAHHEAMHKCPNCDQKFVYRSAVQFHHFLHLKHKLFKCFAGNCTAAYKWRQDLHRHIQLHLQIVHRCKLCEYSSSELRLVRRHQRVHMEVYKYYCINYPQCPFKTKYWTSNHRHKSNCKFL